MENQRKVVSIYPDGNLKASFSQNVQNEGGGAWPATGKAFHPGPQPQKAYTVMPNGVVLPEGEFVAPKRQPYVNSALEIAIGRYNKLKQALTS